MVLRQPLRIVLVLVSGVKGSVLPCCRFLLTRRFCSREQSRGCTQALKWGCSCCSITVPGVFLFAEFPSWGFPRQTDGQDVGPGAASSESSPFAPRGWELQRVLWEHHARAVPRHRETRCGGAGGSCSWSWSPQLGWVRGDLGGAAARRTLLGDGNGWLWGKSSSWCTSQLRQFGENSQRGNVAPERIIRGIVLLWDTWPAGMVPAEPARGKVHRAWQLVRRSGLLAPPDNLLL